MAPQASSYHADAGHEIETGGQIPPHPAGVCDDDVAAPSNQISICCEEAPAMEGDVAVPLNQISICCEEAPAMEGDVAVLSSQISICCEEAPAVEGARSPQTYLDVDLKASMGQHWLVDAMAGC